MGDDRTGCGALAPPAEIQLGFNEQVLFQRNINHILGKAGNLRPFFHPHKSTYFRLYHRLSSLVLGPLDLSVRPVMLSRTDNVAVDLIGLLELWLRSCLPLGCWTPAVASHKPPWHRHAAQTRLLCPCGLAQTGEQRCSGRRCPTLCRQPASCASMDTAQPLQCSTCRNTPYLLSTSRCFRVS